MTTWINAINKAQEFIISSGVDSLPVNIEHLYSQNNWDLYKCSEVYGMTKKSDPFKIMERNIDGKTYSRNGNIITIFNEEMLPQRIRYTLGHEAGHIVMGHLELDETSCFCGVDEKQHKAIEQEANRFASELLAPMVILKEIGVQSWQEIAYLCCISREAAENRFQSYIRCTKTWTTVYEKILISRFRFYIDRILDSAPSGAVNRL